jgi:hypothetical protein
VERAARGLGLGDVSDPAIWGGRVAFFLVDRKRARLDIARIGGGARRHVPLPAFGDREEPTALDLRGDRIAYILRTTSDDDEAHDTQVLVAGRLDRTAGAEPLDRGGDGEECTVNLASPQLTAHGVQWLRAAVGEPGTCRPDPRLHRLDFATGRRSAIAMPVAPAAAVVAGGRTLVLVPQAGTADLATREACAADSGDDQRACRLTDRGKAYWRHR